MKVIKLPIKKNSYLIVKGPSTIRVDKGLVEIFGAIVREGGRTTVLSGRQIPVIATKDSLIELRLGDKADYEFIGENPIPKEWREIYDMLKQEKGFKVIILGDVDVGKSSLILYLANMLSRDGFRIGIIDADIGQSDIGPPGTIGLSILDRDIPSFEEAKLYDAYFVGDKTPTGHLLPVVIGTSKMVKKALNANVDGVLINTTGYIHGGIARALKKHKIEVVNPTHIIGLCLNKELLPLIKSLGIDDRVTLLKSPKYISRKEFRDRREFRHLKMGIYFFDSKEYVYQLSRITLENTVIQGCIKSKRFADLIYNIIKVRPEGVFIDRDEVYVFFKKRLSKSDYMKIFNRLRLEFNNVRIISIESIKGLYLGLYNGGRFQGVGRLEDISLSQNRILLKASSEIKNIDKIVFGYLILDEKFNEKTSIKPGYLG